MTMLLCNSLSRGLLLSLCVTIIGLPCAMAGGVTWTLPITTFADGATASGTFVYDAATQTYSSINFVTTAGSTFGASGAATFIGIVPGNVGDSGTLALTPNPAAPDFTGTIVLAIMHKGTPFTNSGGTFPVQVLTGKCVSNACDSAPPISLLANSTLTAAPSSDCAQPASVSIYPGGSAFGPGGGGPFTINVTDPFGCGWSVTGIPSWIQGVVLNHAQGLNGVGNDTVNYGALPNPGAFRTATMTVAGLPFVVEQANISISGTTTTGSLAQIASAGTWATTFSYVNLGSASALARTNFFADNGNSLVLPLTFPQSAPGSGPLLAAVLDRTLNPGASLVISTTGPDAQPAKVGWAKLVTNGTVGGFATFTDPFFNWNAVVPLETRGASSYLLAFDNTGALATGVALANLNVQSAAINVVIRDDTGAQIATSTINLPVQGHTNFMLNDPQLGYPITVGKRGTVEFDRPAAPGSQISVLGLRANGPALTTLPVLANVGTAGGAIAHSTFNGGFTSTFYLVNTGAASAPFTLSFFDDSGNPQQVPLSLPQLGVVVPTSALTRTLAAGAMLEIDTQAQDALPLVQGSAQLATTGTISGFEVFRWTTFGQEASVPLETRIPNSFVLIFDNTNGLTTGLALSNVSNQAANVTVNLRDDTGAPLQTAVIAVPALGHTSFMLPDTYAAAAGKRGTVEFVTPTGGRISVIGLRAAPGGTLTTIPVLSR